MDESKRWQMQELLKTGAQELQLALIAKTRTNVIEVSKADRWESAGPGLRPTGNVGVSRWMYGNDDVTRLGLQAAWRDVAACLSQAPLAALGDVVAVVQPIFPDLPFRSLGDLNPSGVIARFVVACSWHHGRLKVTSTTAELLMDGMTYGLADKALMWDNNYKRMRALSGESLTTSLTGPVGRRRLALKATAGVVRHLNRELPEHKSMIDSLFGAAVYLGHDYEKLINKFFDVINVHPDDEITVDELGVWEKALHIIDTSVLNPVEQLYEVLYPLMGFNAFKKVFGTPGLRRDGKYRDDTRARHRELLDDIRRGTTDLSILKLGGGAKASAAQKLYDLQTMIGKC